MGKIAGEKVTVGTLIRGLMEATDHTPHNHSLTSQGSEGTLIHSGSLLSSGTCSWTPTAAKSQVREKEQHAKFADRSVHLNQFFVLALPSSLLLVSGDIPKCQVHIISQRDKETEDQTATTAKGIPCWRHRTISK